MTNSSITHIRILLIFNPAGRAEKTAKCAVSQCLSLTPGTLVDRIDMTVVWVNMSPFIKTLVTPWVKQRLCIPAPTLLRNKLGLP